MSSIVDFLDPSQQELAGILAEGLTERLAQLSLERKTKIDETARAVRCVVNERLYEVTFCRDAVRNVYALYLGNRGGRMFEIRRDYAASFRRALDPIIDVARGARGQSAAEAAVITRKLFISQLKARQRQLTRDAAKVEALIVLLQRDLDLASPPLPSPALVPAI